MLGVCLKYMMRNYGSQLQARATIKIFEDFGLEYEILNYKKKGVLFRLKNLHRLFNPVFIDNLLLSIQKKKALSSIPQVEERNKLFDYYSRQHFARKTVDVDYYKDLQKIAEKYDAVITCSDQLWSPAGLGTNFYDLMFVPDHIRKISFSSSFGVSQLMSNQKKKTKRFLERIEYISMRENEGAIIVKELTGRDVPVLLDPVFYYDKKEWESIVPPKSVYNFPYLMCYFLGGNVEYRKRVKEFAQKNNIKIVAINFCNSFIDYDKSFGDVVPYDVDSDRFLNILRGASYICTDSFHGAAFSIIMQKKFVIFNRYSDGASISRNSRINSLCDNLGLKECRGDECTDLSGLFAKDINYADVNEVIQQYKYKAEMYLNNAFKGLKQH